MVEIFQSFAYPIAVSIVSLTALGIVGRYLIKRMDKRDEELAKYRERKDEELTKLRDQLVAYLQMANTEATGAIKENAEAFKKNAEAFKEIAVALNRISAVIERFENILSKIQIRNS